MRSGATPGEAFSHSFDEVRVCVWNARHRWSIEFQRESLNHAIADPATGPDQSGLLQARRYG